MKVLLGVCGGIAAYKAAEILRFLQDHAVDVEVTMTSSARRFITPQTFTALTGKRVHTSLWKAATSPDAPIEHIAVAQRIDALLVAPATANTLARFAHGMADDFLSTTYLATGAPTLVAPAMNVNMWQHPATQENLWILRSRGVQVIEPEAGYLACGMTGNGRLASTPSIVEATLAALTRRVDLSGETVVVTAGGTREAIDPVRFIGNRSSGRMGHAIADAAAARGARVILISTSALPSSPACERVSVTDTQSMQDALRNVLPQATMVFMAAAVADFRPVHYSREKLRRGAELTLQFESTPDLVAAAVAERRPSTLIVAFAAETANLEANAHAKLLRKGADAIFANYVSDAEIGFESEHNAGIFLTRDRQIRLPKTTKAALAHQLLDHALALRSPRSEARPAELQAS